MTRMLKEMQQKLKSMRTNRISLSQATSLLVFHMSQITTENVELEKPTLHALEKSSLFHNSMAELHNQHAEADMALIWSLEEQKRMINVAEEALKMRKSQLRKLWNIKIKKIVDDDPNKEVIKAEEEFETLSKKLKSELGKYFIIN